MGANEEEEIRTITRRMESYGYRRMREGVNRLLGRRVRKKRGRRVMRMHGLQIPPEVSRRTGRGHTGRIATEQSNVRWYSDVLELACQSGQGVEVGSVLDRCDWVALGWVAPPRDLTSEGSAVKWHERGVRQSAAAAGPCRRWSAEHLVARVASGLRTTGR